MPEKLESIDTPALVVDLDQMEANLQKMQAYVDSTDRVLRPHAKAHKIPEIAAMQLALGAKGVCVSKLGEAEVMLAGGVDDVLITTPVANPLKINRLINLCRTYPEARIIQVIDHEVHALAINRAAMEAGVVVEVLVEVECGQQRCGVRPGENLLRLIQQISGLPALCWLGLQAYSGHLQHIHGYQKRVQMARDAVRPVFDFIEQNLVPAGLYPEIVSGGGSGTYDACTGMGFTEIQAGSYLFMDWHYHTIGARNDDEVYRDFGCSLKVWTTVISQPEPSRAVVDAGMKCLSIDSGMPRVEGRNDIEYRTGGDEHGILHFADPDDTFEIGQRLLMIPSHCDTTLNQFSTLYGIRKGVVEKHWLIEGRGRSD